MIQPLKWKVDFFKLESRKVDFFLYKEANASQNMKEYSRAIGIYDNKIKSYKLPDLSSESRLH